MYIKFTGIIYAMYFYSAQINIDGTYTGAEV
jgi:hypothetical protein